MRVLPETGFLKSGRLSAGVARPYRGTAGNVEPCQSGVLRGSARSLGYALLDRERSLPEAWSDDGVPYQQVGLPADRPVATKPPLAQ